MKKQGFTLIELMVVIVIMGILAAVAVPKLFGQIAKSKASEVATNASAYKTAQDAYAMTNNGVGKKTDIGYDEPKEGNFKYNASSSEGVWTATANIALNECKASSVWTLKGEYKSSTGKVKWSTTIGNGAAATSGNDATCLAMTPGFDKLAD